MGKPQARAGQAGSGAEDREEYDAACTDGEEHDRCRFSARRGETGRNAAGPGGRSRMSKSTADRATRRIQLYAGCKWWRCSPRHDTRCFDFGIMLMFPAPARQQTLRCRHPSRRAPRPEPRWKLSPCGKLLHLRRTTKARCQASDRDRYAGIAASTSAAAGRDADSAESNAPAQSVEVMPQESSPPVLTVAPALEVRIRETEQSKEVPAGVAKRHAGNAGASASAVATAGRDSGSEQNGFQSDFLPGAAAAASSAAIGFRCRCGPTASGARSGASRKQDGAACRSAGTM